MTTQPVTPLGRLREDADALAVGAQTIRAALAMNDSGAVLNREGVESLVAIMEAAAARERALLDIAEAAQASPHPVWPPSKVDTDWMVAYTVWFDSLHEGSLASLDAADSGEAG